MAREGLTAIVDNPAVGHFLKSKLFDLGARYRWGETIERATGERLTPRYWAARL
jgi:Zn-dependent M32 family carboxypeptidase